MQRAVVHELVKITQDLRSDGLGTYRYMRVGPRNASQFQLQQEILRVNIWKPQEDVQHSDP